MNNYVLYNEGTTETMILSLDSEESRVIEDFLDFVRRHNFRLNQETFIELADNYSALNLYD